MFAQHRTAPKKVKLGAKPTTLAAYTGVFLLIMSMVAIGYQPPKQVDTVASAVDTVGQSSAPLSDQPSVDEIVATNVASGIASRANLPVAANIANQSVSLSIKSQLAQTDTASIAKPQIVQPTADDRSIKTYVTKAGDSVTSIASDFGISTDTVKWANNLTGDAIAVDKEIKILPVDGVLYTVAEGDTLDSIAKKYATSGAMITIYNDLELSGVVKDAQLIVPSGVLPTEDRPGYIAPRTYTAPAPQAAATYGFAGTSYGFNGGDFTVINPYDLISKNIKNWTNGGANGQCTWWAIERRAAIGRPLPGGALGNAADWSYTLAGRFAINRTPAVGAVIQNGGGYGHVGVVESMNADGSITISEMNYYPAGGPFNVDIRTIPASAVGTFNYIH